MSLRYLKNTELRNPVVYKIESPTGNVYIGQTYFFAKRMMAHKNRATSNKTDFVVNSIRKHGFDNHKVDIVCTLPKDIEQDVFDRYEQIYIDRFRECGFKMMNSRDASSRGKFSEETRKKMSLAQLGNKNNLGKKRPNMSYEWRQKIGDGNRGKIKHTNEHKLKMSNRMKGNKHTKNKEIHNKRKSILQYTLGGQFIKEWKGVNLTADTLGFGRSSLTNCLTGYSKSANGFIWKYNNKK